MSVHEQSRRLTAPDIRARKGGEALVCLTSYHAHTARILDSYCDVILVGDSLGMVMHGLESTVPVTLDMMILQGNAVMRGCKRALVVIDLPFGSYEASKEQAFTSAARVLKETGCGAVKLEGGRRMAETIAFLVERGAPVMGHVGLTPQAINTLGSFRAQGRHEYDWAPIEADARAVADAGAFSVVLEAIAEPLARRITSKSCVRGRPLANEPDTPRSAVAASPRLALRSVWLEKLFCIIAAFAMSAASRSLSSCALVRGEDGTNELSTACASVAASRSLLMLVTSVASLARPCR